MGGGGCFNKTFYKISARIAGNPDFRYVKYL